MRAISEVRDQGAEYGWDGACIAVAMPKIVTPYLDLSFEEWEDLCRDFGFEFIDADATGRNEYGGKSLNTFTIGSNLRQSIQSKWESRVSEKHWKAMTGLWMILST